MLIAIIRHRRCHHVRPEDRCLLGNLISSAIYYVSGVFILFGPIHHRYLISCWNILRSACVNMGSESVVENVISIIIRFPICMLGDVISIWDCKSLIFAHQTFGFVFACERAPFNLLGIHLLDNKSIILFHTFICLYIWISLVLWASINHRWWVQRLRHFWLMVVAKLAVVEHRALSIFKLVIYGTHRPLVILGLLWFLVRFAYINFLNLWKILVFSQNALTLDVG